ncbi:DNA directed RNA polymerase III subunit Rpc82, putative [Talaromyces stipitatus ATCC 10500]|uniref:DNA-directed RNA polymerase III subunit RPC3 n=1 Tax=Talaromyces stipitatus (strain ATCC 10500 / CBS 375.48 / QM 6759 / NRRL 1006) TaxID=441959 RepID=B8MIN9_TALSN|nr:DNA directed RNA polymerase III subunit Rpc82, putative [Talaromyces stipitatus ATCC 10500]EED15131.1 DNA directed RNA polymerase III subunit Rpc82, putative [Talaromyces stipitatus ATCC 10500]
MSQYAAELCTLLVEDNFGDLFGRIYSTLVQYGRLSLLRLREHSKVTHKQLLHALAALVQMHLVHHFTSIDDGFTYYEANVDGAYYLIRMGKILEVVEDRLGSYAARVMSAIAYHGHIMISDLEALQELQDDADGNADGEMKNEDNESENTENGVEGNGLTNGDGDDHTASNSRLHSTLNYLAGHGYICRVKDVHFHSLTDNALEAEREAIGWAANLDSKGKKKSAEIDEKKREILNDRMDADLSAGLTAYARPPVNKRRQESGHSENPHKRRRVESDDESDNENSWEEDDVEDKETLRPTLVVRVNYQKLDVVLRNRRLVELALQGTSPATAEVYETLLRLIEYKTSCCREGIEIPREGEESETGSVAITLQRLANEIDPRLDLKGTLGPLANPQTTKNNKRTLANGVNGNHHGDLDEDDTETTRTHDVDQHLNILALPPYSLSTRRGGQGSVPAWYVEYRRLARQLRHFEIERIVGIRFGKLALRVIRILLSVGKLDEKRLQEVSLIAQKDLRQVLAQMQENGFVDLQEIPKDAQRIPNRTVYLWFYDPDRVGRNVLHDIYKAMSRCLQRLRFERNRLKDFLDKTERIDVRGNEEEYLTEAELETLRQWREKEALMLGEISRLDDLVAVFRDF